MDDLSAQTVARGGNCLFQRLSLLLEDEVKENKAESGRCTYNKIMTAFCDRASCSLVEADRRFRSEYCFRHQGLMTEEVRISETLVYVNENTLRYITGDCPFHTRRRENL
jgi:hypothetical protein